MRAKLTLATVALCLMLLASCGPSTARELPGYVPEQVAAQGKLRVQVQSQASPTAVSETINIDQPETYPPMPVGSFSYVERDEVGQRVHYTVTAILAGVTSSGSSRTLGRTAQTTVLLFTDGTGLVLTCRAIPAVTSGLAWVHYSVPPSMVGRPTAVLVHGLERMGD